MTDRAKVTIDQATLTFAEMAAIEDELGRSLSDIFEHSQSRGMAALVWVTVRRTDPTFTFDQAMAYGPADVVNVVQAPEAVAANNGGSPQLSPVPGESIPVT